jgi:hypothetical protein
MMNSIFYGLINLAQPVVSRTNFSTLPVQCLRQPISALWINMASAPTNFS